MDRNLFEMHISQTQTAEITVARLREAAMLGNVTSGPGFNEDYMPTTEELETIAVMCKDAVSTGRVIDFGFWPNDTIKLASKRAGPMYNTKALAQPFSSPWIFLHSWNDSIFAEFPELDKHGGKVCNAYLVNPFPGDDGSTLGVDCEISVLDGFNVFGDFVLGVGDRVLVLPNEAEPNTYHCEIAAAIHRFNNPDGSPSKIVKEFEKKYGSITRASTCNALDPFMTALLIVNTRGVPRYTVAADVKLNKARAKKGKLPIPNYDRIDSSGYVTALQAHRNVQRNSNAGGTHASPIPHLRRGHWRNYEDGERTFIRDTLVKVTPELREQFISNRSHYKA